MLTEVGKFLRKLRIDHNEILLDMSEVLNVTPSFLSAVENGKKSMPPTWYNIIVSGYSLNEQQITEFQEAIAKTQSSISINLNDISDTRKMTVLSFARQISELEDDQVHKINEILRMKYKGR